MKNPTIGVVTTNTNSLSKNYLAFFACIKSWIKIADDLVIVDGGTNDETYSVLNSFVGKNKYRIIKTELTTWNDKSFHAGQWGINNYIGLNSLETDWAIIVPADHVLDKFNILNLYKELKNKSSELALRFKRKRYFYDKILFDEKFYIINLKLTREKKINIGWGYDPFLKHLPDDPIIINYKSHFYDSITNINKFFYGGKKIRINNTINSIECWSFGFYFFKIKNAIDHLFYFYLNYNFRFFGRPMITKEALMKKEKLHLINGYLNNGKKKYLPKNIIELNDLFSFDDIIGNAILSDKKENFNDILLRPILYFKRIKLKIMGLKSLEHLHNWVSLDKFSKPLNLKSIYNKQDKYLK